MASPTLPPDIATVVSRAIAEDLGDGDLTAALIAANTLAVARGSTRHFGSWIRESPSTGARRTALR